MIKTRLELECKCKLCKMSFIIWDGWVPKYLGSGLHISGLKCPNCQQPDLDFDIMLGRAPKLGS